MGRYYSTNNFYGKFGFAVQPSSDPEIFGMTEQEPLEITYSIFDENIEYVTKVLDDQYDICGVPKEERIYEIESDDVLAEYMEGHVDMRVYREYDEENDEGIPYAGFTKEFIEHNGYKSDTLYPNKPGVMLARCRILLGLRILTDLKWDGCCTLVAEI